MKFTTSIVSAFSVLSLLFSAKACTYGDPGVQCYNAGHQIHKSALFQVKDGIDNAFFCREGFKMEAHKYISICVDISGCLGVSGAPGTSIFVAMETRDHDIYQNLCWEFQRQFDEIIDCCNWRNDFKQGGWYSSDWGWLTMDVQESGWCGDRGGYRVDAAASGLCTRR